MKEEIERGVSAPPKISVIVPVYNTEKYLRHCIDSILAQTFTDFELLLIDDGSNDTSGSICDEYSRTDVRIKSVHKVNGGVSSARNLGLSMASGKYIIFLDADDYWTNKDILGLFFSTSEKYDLDIVSADYFEVDAFEHRLTEAKNQLISSNHKMDYFHFITNVVKREYFIFLLFFKAHVFSDIRFSEGRKFMEDAEIYMKLFMKDLNCMHLSTDFYAYRKHQLSVTGKYSLDNIGYAFDFTRVCLSLIPEYKDMQIKRYVVEEGVNNYYYYTDKISQDKKVMSCIGTWCEKWRLNDLNHDISQFIGGYLNRYHYPQSCLSIPILLRYYVLIHKAKSLLRPLVRCLKSIGV